MSGDCVALKSLALSDISLVSHLSFLREMKFYEAVRYRHARVTG
ncbi:hypothetical protein NIES2104_28750 [Leptolyngbya sp. NIES-2104]|nr:hypothetical protein NIES2104_28750 [Leptolyngbya sp. NIES-2104]